METRGLHLLIEYHGCDAAPLDDPLGVDRTLRRAAEAAGATPVDACFHRFAPQGVTGVVALVGGHISIHTWPERGYAAVDVFLSGGGDLEAARRVIGDAMGAGRSTHATIERGRGGARSMRAALGDRDDGGATTLASPRPDGMIYEPLVRGVLIGHRCRDVVFARETPAQRVELLTTEGFGQALFVDGDLNSAADDEFIYHEALVHPAMARAGAPRRVLIIGGGEGGTLREVLRWQTVERAVMVDVDHALVETCRAHLRDVYGDPFADPRATLHIGCGRGYLEQRPADDPAAPDGFDVVIIDLPDPTPQSPVRWLYTREFYAAVRRALRPGGVVVTQGGAFGTAPHRRRVATIGATFAATASLEMFVPSFTTAWAFVLGGDALDRSPAQIDAALAAAKVDGLCAYDGAVDRRMRTPLPAARAALAKPEPVWTDALLTAERVPRP